MTFRLRVTRSGATASANTPRACARRLRGQAGYSLIELLTVLSILLIVLAALTTLYISGIRSEVDLNDRFQAQQEARLAIDKMRREVHCAGGLTLTSAASVTVTLPAACPTAGGTPQTIVYETSQVSTGRYEFRRAGVRVADYLTTGDVFSYVPPTPLALGKLHVELPVDVKPGDSVGDWRLGADIVLRNTTRS